MFYSNVFSNDINESTVSLSLQNKDVIEGTSTIFYFETFEVTDWTIIILCFKRSYDTISNPIIV
jgi:hypothetical protein